MNFSDKAAYFYIKRIKKWMECPVCHRKMLFSKRKKAWCCNHCEYFLLEKDFLDDFVFWFCDGCETYLNIQKGFDRKGSAWVCKQCGFENDITEANIRNECNDCGAILENPNVCICSSCKTKRMQRAQKVLQGAADICHTLSDAFRGDNMSLNENAKELVYDACGEENGLDIEEGAEVKQ